MNSPIETLDDVYTPISVTLLDTETGQTVKLPDDLPLGSYWWAEGNGSCDCNRGPYFDYDEDKQRTNLGIDDATCLGCRRFLIVEAPTRFYTLKEFNADYPKELLDKYGITD